MDLKAWLATAVASNADWVKSFGPYQAHPALAVDDARFAAAFEVFTERLKDNYPFFHPRYAGQMLKPPHPAAVVGYLTAMLINPNNHALDGGPATAEMEREAVQQLATMFGYDTHLGHLTTSGTIANLEALFVARELHPGKGVAYSTEAHYTHGRMCRVLGVEGHPVPVDDLGRMDLDALERVLRTGRVGTVVLTAGTTGLGAVEPIHEALALRERYGVRIHVDAAYGGFFTLLAGAPGPEGLPEEPWRAIAEADSIVVDPHKHGLQPYGCGAVLFRDPSVGRFYLHDSPYTYFTSEELHLGEISLECSRAGAAAAALWLTFQLIPPTREGLGQSLAAGRRAALRWAELIEGSAHLELYQAPELDIVSYFPVTEAATLSQIDAASNRILQEGMTDSDPVFVSTLRVGADRLTALHPKLVRDADGARVLRSVLMKPESEGYVDHLHERLERLARA
ncbi:pyridoxal phosphate-dependent decarboxylase family protein [Streptomyces rapamycinicus]|uniref:Pyridoxal-dependent decarboxylase n=2 Tax=Streptomyces rapamycinicus TaxID=1226757 RepID=A0A0A0NRH1_STRRN|nr:aminotransferase class I/II-fold pyridoxal phosphate-dependent enzyme [Streptomyces rapamycinicus]AGP59891.1 pyridoxal-dependent decarboxylase [Streptomyces rapamycinicus NRRL 5491]MBB4788950.1 glutamate/tyrosine decarboxylase-like PLP-dependent enzyme [Streptomyces rapamycinicus]RLV76921.1 pyridoxal-dependent decarboxylase [Streptomyces rapamycinicus NRRL 5491]UTO67564.1 aminotransferase class V-fold PLP-dependent enzyme [Streptomyces rapamycinicus]UTP35518.1 aminotransferase class V-fold 